MLDEKITKESIINTLNEDENRKYYVYALCEKSDGKLIPFYIGKGQGGRVWEHELETEEELKQLKNYYSGEELKAMQLETTKKHQTINKIGKENIEKIIIKWGLTSDEAFMAESALINIFQLENLFFNIQEQKLTNIANGHASEIEKSNKSPYSSARNLNDFYVDCVEPPIKWDDLDSSVIGIKVVFKNINVFYDRFCKSRPKNQREISIKESARGCWRIRNTNLPEYLFAMNRDKIVGVYKIKDIKPVYDISEYPAVPNREGIEKEIEMNQRINDALSNNKTTFSTIDSSLQEMFKDFLENEHISSGRAAKKGKSIDPEKEYNNWINRRYYTVEEAPQYIVEKYLNKTIRKDDGKAIFGQSGIRYNYL